MHHSETPKGFITVLALVAFVGCGSPGPVEHASPPGTEPAPAPSFAARARATQESPTASPPSVAETPPEPIRGIGLAVPTTLLAASQNGDWVALCQAQQDTDGDGRLRAKVTGHGENAGDRLKPYFVERGGSGMPIDAFVGGDPSGRFVAFVRAGRLILRDIHAQLETDLSTQGADVRADLASYAPHRAGSFHPDGGRFVYLRVQGSRSRVVVRELPSGRETLIDPGAGSLWRAEFEGDGDFLHLRVVPKDTNGDGKVRWPVPVATANSSGCSLPVSRFVVGDAEPDRVAHLLYRLRDGKLFERSGFVMSVADHLLTRTDEAELWLEAPDGDKRLVAGKDCLPRVLHVVAPSKSILFGCTSEYGQRRRLQLSTPDRTLKLGYEVAAFESDGRFSEAPRHLVLSPGNESILVDTVTGRVTKLPSGTTLIASHGGALLVERAAKLWWLGSEGTERDSGFRRRTLTHVIQRGRYVTVGTAWFDLETTTGPVELPSEPLAISRHGSVLLAASVDDAGFANGPLEWRSVEAR